MNPPSVESIEQTRRIIIDLSIRYGPKILTALVFLFVGVLVSRRAGRFMQQWLTKRELEPPVRMLIGRGVSLLVLLLFVLMSLQNLGIELLPLFAGLGVAGVGVGLAMQGVLSNLSAGLTIIFTRPFRVGEYVALVGVEGQVDTIELFATTLVHSDCSRVVIPNRKIVGEILHNYGKIRQLDLAVSVAYAVDLDKAMRTIGEVLKQNPRVKKELTPVVGVTYLDDSGVKISIKPWVSVADFIPAAGELNAAILLAFRAGQIDPVGRTLDRTQPDFALQTLRQGCGLFLHAFAEQPFDLAATADQRANDGQAVVSFDDHPNITNLRERNPVIARRHDRLTTLYQLTRCGTYTTLQQASAFQGAPAGRSRRGMRAPGYWPLRSPSPFGIYIAPESPRKAWRRQIRRSPAAADAAMPETDVSNKIGANGFCRSR